VNTAMNLGVPLNALDFLTSQETVTFPRVTLLYVVVVVVVVLSVVVVVVVVVSVVVVVVMVVSVGVSIFNFETRSQYSNTKS
jgi:hypothetical protein